jgi:hypothetical protein
MLRLAEQLTKAAAFVFLGVCYIGPMHPLFSLLIVAIGAVGPSYMLAKRVGPAVPLAFIAAYVLALGAIAIIPFPIDIDIGDYKFPGWLTLNWPILIAFFAPSVISALLACWFSRPSVPRDAAALLGVYLFLILVAIGFLIFVAIGPLSARREVPFWFLVVELALGATFFAMALWWRVAKGEQREPSALHSNSGP